MSTKHVEALGASVRQGCCILARCQCCGRLWGGNLCLTRVWVNGEEFLVVGVMGAGQGHEIAAIPLSEIVTAVTAPAEPT